MKKALFASPNLLLKQERELRGWSQNDVAQKIGCDHYYLSRWERGLTNPSAYYRQKLCALFGKNAEELGLLQRSPQQQEQDQGSQRASLVEGGVLDPAIPFSLLTSESLIGRNLLLEQLKQSLCEGKSGRAVAISGLPGVGKTALAVALVQDSQIQEHFVDGILWAGLGPTPSVLGLLSRWGTLLGITTEQANRLISSEGWMKAIRAAIGMRRFLLVVDDAWRIEAALAFKVGGPYCAYLLTTRFPQIALQCAPNAATPIHELNEEESKLLLNRLAPNILTSEAETMRALACSVGGLPLALTIMGNYLRNQGYSKQPRRIQAALARLRDIQERLCLTDPRALSERPICLSENVPVSLQTVIAMSELHLDEQARHALHALSIFRPKPNSFTEEAATTVCALPVIVLDALTDAGLLESSEPGRYTMHQIIADYARAHLADSKVHERLVTYFVRFVVTHEKDYAALEPETVNIFAALETAFIQNFPEELLRGCNAFFSFLYARGLHTQAQTHLAQAEQIARSGLYDGSLMSVLLANLGSLAIARGESEQAQAYLQEGLAIARQLGQQDQVALFLLNLGHLASNQAKNTEAQAYFEEGLAVARLAGSGERIGRLLAGLGFVLIQQGRYEQAQMYLREGLELAHQLEQQDQVSLLSLNLGMALSYTGNLAEAECHFQAGLEIARRLGQRSSICMLLTALGWFSDKEGSYTQAESYLQEGLVLARQLGEPQRTGYLLSNLGSVTYALGDYTRAETYLQEALNIATQIADDHLTSIILNTWGKLYLARQQFASAATAFHKVLEKASASENQEMIAGANYGMAQVALKQNNPGEATLRGQASLALFESIGHPMAAEVRTWGEALSIGSKP